MHLMAVMLLIALTAGCVQQNTCSPPYLAVGNECCLDEDQDRVCDRDKLPKETTSTATTTTSSTTTTQKKIKFYSPEIVGYYRKDMELRNLTCYLNTTACINNACRTFLRIVECNYTEKDIIKGMMTAIASKTTTSTTRTTTSTATTTTLKHRVVYSQQVIGYIEFQDTNCYLNKTTCIGNACQSKVKTVDCNFTENDLLRAMLAGI